MIQRIAGLLAVVLLTATSVRAEPRASAHLYVRGSANITAILRVMKSDLVLRGKKEPPLLVILVDPAHHAARGVAKLNRSLDWLRRHLPEGGRVVMIAVDGDWPKLDEEPQDFAKTCRVIAAKPRPGVRNLLGDVRRAARFYRGWKGPKDLLLMASVGTDGEEATEETLASLSRHGWRFSVVAGEAAFSRPWSFAPALPPEHVLRLTGHPDQRRATIYPACEGPFPDAVTAWDLGLAPTALRLTPAGKPTAAYVLPSGFGYYHLARLAGETGGRYFLYGFVRRKGGIRLSYDYGMLRLFEPDLRSRTEILAGLARHPLASALYRIWGRLAQARVGVIERAAPLGPSGPDGRLRSAEEAVVTPNRLLKLAFTGKGDTVWVMDTLRQRLVAVEGALTSLEAAVRQYRSATGGRVRTNDHRWIAQIDLLRLQLLRVRFHMGEILATLTDLRDDDFHNKRIVLFPRAIFRGSVPVRGEPLPAEPRQLRFLHEALGETERMEDTYAGTPWGYMASLGQLYTWLIRTYEKGGSRPVERSRSHGKKDGTPKPKPRPKPTPGSTGSGTATGD